MTNSVNGVPFGWAIYVDRDDRWKWSDGERGWDRNEAKRVALEMMGEQGDQHAKIAKILLNARQNVSPISATDAVALAERAYEIGAHGLLPETEDYCISINDSALKELQRALDDAWSKWISEQSVSAIWIDPESETEVWA